MERMLARIAAVLAVLVAPVAAAQLAPAAPSPAVPPAAVTPAPAASAADPALTFGLADDRMTVPVSIDRRGPWPFIVDTGAERSVVSSELAGRLGLAAGPMVRVVAMAGPKVVPSALVPALSVSSLPATDVVAPAFAQSDLGAPGMLGIDALQGHRLDIDFDHRSMTLHPSRRHHVTSGGHDDEIVVVARSMLGQLIVTDAHWRGRRVAVVIDTGSGMTLGNPALQRLIAARAKRLGTVTAKAVTGETLTAEATTIGELTLGKIVIAQMPVAFTDAPPFRRFGLERRPAVMLGMDALRLFRRVRIDFANRAIEFQLPAALLAPQPGQPSA